MNRQRIRMRSETPGMGGGIVVLQGAHMNYIIGYMGAGFIMWFPPEVI